MPQENTNRWGGFDPAVYLTLADMRADPDVHGPTDGPALAVLTGGTAAFDVTPSGLFGWNAASSASDNGSTVIQPTAVTGNGRWIRLAA